MGRDTKASHPLTSKSAVRAMPRPLQQVRELVLDTLQVHLAQVMSNCDDTFFELSGKSASNSEQNLYFESMREVRARKDSILSECRRQLYQVFDQQLLHDTPAQVPESLVQDGLSLVADDDIEQDVALSSMVSKARASNQEALYHIKCRIDALIPGFQAGDQNNPLDPEALCKSFKQATADLDLDIVARIVLFKQFDREVIAGLPDIYQAANELLIEAGVLPTIKSSVKKQASASPTSQATPPEAQPPAAETPASDFGLAQLGSLMNSLHKLSIQPASFIPRYSARSGPVVTQEELLRLLAELQASISYEEILHQQTLDIRSALEQIMASMDEVGSPDHALDSPDEDVINLVAMFFDFVLNDPALPLSFQALISRLQLPILKLALRDADFFDTNRHPARILINDIARLGVGCDDTNPGKQDLVVVAIEEIIQAIHDNPGADATLFEAMCGKLQAVASKQQHKAELVEKRARETASGQARTEAARDKIRQELQQRLKDTELPEPIGKFLVEDWQNVLLMTYLKQGENSAEWIETLQLVDDLIWSVGDHDDDKSRARRARLLPALGESIRKGLRKTVANKAEREAIAGVIDNIHGLLQQGRADEVRYDALQPEREEALQVEQQAQKSWQEMSAVERQQAKQERITYDNIRKVDALEPGTWMIFVDPASGDSLRCKLAARLEETDSFIFVNRFGFKSLEKKRKDVAHELQLNRATVIDSRPLFDRAFSKIAYSLKEMGQAATS